MGGRSLFYRDHLKNGGFRLRDEIMNGQDHIGEIKLIRC